jgi:hypothetical protein
MVWQYLYQGFPDAFGAWLFDGYFEIFLPVCICVVICKRYNSYPYMKYGPCWYSYGHYTALMVLILLTASILLTFFMYFFLYVSQIQLLSHAKLIVCMYWSHSRTFRSSTRMFCYVHMLLKLKCAVPFVLCLGLIWRGYVATCSKELRRLCANVWKIQVSIRISMAFIQLQVYFSLPLQRLWSWHFWDASCHQIMCDCPDDRGSKHFWNVETNMVQYSRRLSSTL